MNDPVLIAYSVKQTSGGKSIWTKIGAAYPHEQGVVLDAMPLGRRIVLLELDDDADGHSTA